MTNDTYFITTAIDYTNAPPHIGHAYEKILADVLARHQRQRGKSVFFLTGVDQHGQKVQQAAEKEGVSPQTFATNVTEKFLSLWQTLGISNDEWAATTAPSHHQVVQKILQDLHDRNDLYKATHHGFYSVRQEQFLTDKERDENGQFGPEWGEVIELAEENWYFRLSKYQPWLEEFATKNPNFVFPAYRSQELLNAVSRTSSDLCISRPKSRLSWGIELPFDPEFVTYVWFDALINYISFAGYESPDPASVAHFAKYWPATHVIGKDILVPAHGIYWMSMLKAIGFPDDALPQLLVHGYVNLRGSKVSKSIGNTVDPVELAHRYSAEALRYYLTADCQCGQDMEFSEERLIARYNSNLANGLGNLLNRAISMSRRYRGGILQFPSNAPASAQALITASQAVWEPVAQAMDHNHPQQAIDAILTIIDQANAFAETEAPWKLAKDPANTAHLDAVLYAMVTAVHHAASLLSPVIPQKSEAILAQLQLPLLSYGQEHQLIPNGHQVGEPSPLFPRLELSSIPTNG